MNRKQRRAAQSQTPNSTAAPKASQADALFGKGALHQDLGQIDDALRAYKKALSHEPDHPATLNNLACLLMATNKIREASERFSQLVLTSPEFLDDFAGIAVTLYAVNKPLGAAVNAVRAGQPPAQQATALLSSAEALDTLTDPLLTTLMRLTTLRDVALEQLLTALRAQLIDMVSKDDAAADRLLPFIGALALQCFVNEYIFAQSTEESAQAAMLRTEIESADTIKPAKLAMLACYIPLGGLSNADALMRQRWQGVVAEIVTQQIVEPAKENELRATIPALTAIDDAVSRAVQKQYEENPYPRWVRSASARKKLLLNEHLRTLFPSAEFSFANEATGVDVLVAGCGTGRHPIEVADLYVNTRVTAIDLSRASLAYAKRKTPAALASRITYGQADILKLPELGKRFDVVESIGVLHHMADPFAAWRSLLPLVHPKGVMHIGLYSELARTDITGAREFIAQHGLMPSTEDIRRARRVLLESRWANVAQSGDFFATSDCRDLLFHVQEQRVTLPQIKAFLEQEKLRFLGFDLPPDVLAHAQSMFAAEGWTFEDLDAWHQFETRAPLSFMRMYQFWVQRD